MDADELELFDRSVRAVVDEHDGRALEDALVDLGWVDALSEIPAAAVGSLFGALGRTGRTSAALGTTLLELVGHPTDGNAFVLPTLGTTGAPGRIEGGRLHVDGLCLGPLDGRGRLVVAARGGDAVVAAAVDNATLQVTPAAGIDPALGISIVRGTVELAATDTVDWEAVVTRGQLAVTHDLLGASRHMLDLAREHALERIQFSQPIARFQAIRHRLAEVLIAIETADAVLTTAWEDGTAETAAIAKSSAGRGARIAAKHCQQVLAGIGFTTEHTLHLFIRRVFVLDQLLGSSQALTKQLGTEVLASKQLPVLLPL